MKYTNNHGLPDILVQWLEYDEYDHEDGVLSATAIMRPIRATVIMERNKDDLEIDVTEVIASRYGTAIHDSFEKVPLKDCIQEKRLYAELDGFRISGKPDILRDLKDGRHQLLDIKSTSVWTVIYGSREHDHILQLSIYRWLAERNGYKVTDDAEIIYIFTDWSKSKAKKDPDYPQLRCMIKPIKLMSIQEIEDYMKERLLAIGYLVDNPDLKLPECNREELWQQDDKWAVMKRGRKTAVKVFDNEQDALEMVAREGENTHWVEHRPGKVNRCDYCPARKFCDQYSRLVEEGLIGD